MLGYDAPKIFQKIHDDAMEEKTKIELNREIIKSQEENKTFVVNQQIQRNQLELGLSMDRIKATIEQDIQKHQFEQKKQESSALAEYDRLAKLKGLGVDIAGYLSKADKTIEIKSPLKDGGMIINP